MTSVAVTCYGCQKTSATFVRQGVTWASANDRHTDTHRHDDGTPRYTITCRPCGLNTQVRSDKLTPILDRLADAGIPAIDTANLVRILGSWTRVAHASR